jgi:hypothetical protein
LERRRRLLVELAFFRNGLNRWLVDVGALPQIRWTRSRSHPLVGESVTVSLAVRPDVQCKEDAGADATMGARPVLIHESARAGLGGGPDECLMVVDSLHNDVCGARRAGLVAILLDRG